MKTLVALKYSAMPFRLRTRMSRKVSAWLLRCMVAAALLLALPLAAFATTLRVGHFPNITHIQGLVAHGLSRQGKGWFEQRLGSDMTIEWFVYNAGPSALEAI